MTAIQMSITIAVCTAATMLTRFFALCGVLRPRTSSRRRWCGIWGRVLPAAIFGHADRLLPQERDPHLRAAAVPQEAIALLVTVALHKWKHETLLSVAGGTLCYVLLVQLVF